MTKQALDKIDNFVKVALAEITQLKQQVHSYQTKEAAELVRQDKELDAVLKKAAEALYNSDFISDEDDKANFVKKAKEDPKYMAKIVERVCNASDVAYMGKVATVKSAGGEAEEDPVMRRAFGYGASYTLLDD